ncbi:hypothetical protein [Streptomyces sp. NPDC055005]
MADNTPRAGQSARRRKASLVADQLLQAAVGTPEVTNGVPATGAVLTRPTARYGLLLAVAAVLTVLAWRAGRRA